MYNVSRAMFGRKTGSETDRPAQRGFVRIIALGVLAVVLAIGMGILTYRLSIRSLGRPAKAGSKTARSQGAPRAVEPAKAAEPAKVPAPAAEPEPSPTPVGPVKPAAESAPVAVQPSLVPAPATSAPATDPQAQARIQRLGKIYGAMNAERAADVLKNLSDDEAVQILSAMNERQTGKILSLMEPRRVASLTRKMGLGDRTP